MIGGTASSIPELPIFDAVRYGVNEVRSIRPVPSLVRLERAGGDGLGVGISCSSHS